MEQQPEKKIVLKPGEEGYLKVGKAGKLGNANPQRTNLSFPPLKVLVVTPINLVRFSAGAEVEQPPKS